MGNTPPSHPASRIRWRFSEGLNHRSVAHTWTPNSRCRKIDDAARPHPRSSTFMPGDRSSDSESHSVSHSELAPPLALESTHSGWYFAERGNEAFARCIAGLSPAFCFGEFCLLIEPRWT